MVEMAHHPHPALIATIVVRVEGMITPLDGSAMASVKAWEEGGHQDGEIHQPCLVNDDSTSSSSLRARKVNKSSMDKMIIRQYPDADSFENWKRELRDAVCAASGRGNKAMPWIVRVENPQVLLDDLVPRPSWVNLDMRLKAALNSVCRGEIQRRVAPLTDKAAVEGRSFGGRQVLKLIYAEFSLNERNSQMLALQDL